MDLLGEIQDLRRRAWEAVTASPPFALYKAMDDAVVAAGGTSITPFRVSTATPVEVMPARAHAGGDLRLTQGDYAEKALREYGEPLPIGRFVEATMKAGAKIGGDDPIANFRSTLSRDARFKSITRNNLYFWWFKDEPLPQNWNEPGADLLATPGSSVHPNQEGGEGHAPKTN